MQHNERERMFEGMVRKTIPFILFTPKHDAYQYIDLVKALYHAHHSHDDTSFMEIHDQLHTRLTTREPYSSMKEELIKSYSTRYLSLYERLNDHDKDIIVIKKAMRKMTRHMKDDTCHVAQEKTVSGNLEVELTRDDHEAKVEVTDLVKADLVKAEKNVKKKSSNNDTLQKLCPVETCGGSLINKGSPRGVQRLWCNSCERAFSVNPSGGFFHCKHCGGLLIGYGVVPVCIDCGKETRIAGEEPKGITVECSCGNEQFFTGKGNYTRCRACKKKIFLTKEERAAQAKTHGIKTVGS